MALHHRPVFADNKVIICALFHSVCCLFHAEFCCLSDREKSSVLLTIPSARSGNTGLNSDELVARDLFQGCVGVSPSGVAFST